MLALRKGPVPVWSAAPGSEEDNGSWALTSDQLPSPRPVPLWDGRKSSSRIVIQEKTQPQNLPSAVWKTQGLYLEKGTLSSKRSKYRSTGQDNLCQCDQI